MHHRRDLFPTDWGLQIRMLIVVGLDAILVAALSAGIVYVTFWVPSGWSLTVVFVLFAAVGARAARKRRRKRGRPVHDRDEARMREALERLCVVADVPAPAVDAVRDEAAQSWTVAVPWKPPTIYATTALLDAVAHRELDAVLAHELSHIVHRDAWVMTLAAAPGIWVWRGLQRIRAQSDDVVRGFAGVVVFTLFFGWIILPFALLARLLSRHRELAADAGAARLIGSPAAVAAALTSLADDLSVRERRDLRVVAARDLLQILPARDPRGVRRLWATHPPLRRRLRALDRLETERSTPARRRGLLLRLRRAHDTWARWAGTSS